MKLVAKRDFANVPKLGLELDAKTKGFVHAGHVHKGHRFTVGSSEIFDDLKPDEQHVVAQLVASKCAVYEVDANKAIIAKIDKEVAEDAKQSASAEAVPGIHEVIAAAVATAVTNALAAVSKPATAPAK